MVLTVALMQLLFSGLQFWTSRNLISYTLIPSRVPCKIRLPGRTAQNENSRFMDKQVRFLEQPLLLKVSVRAHEPALFTLIYSDVAWALRYLNWIVC